MKRVSLRSAVFLLLTLAAPAARAAIPDSEGADSAPAPPAVVRERSAPAPARTPKPHAKRRRSASSTAEPRRPESAAARVSEDRGSPPA